MPTPPLKNEKVNTRLQSNICFWWLHIIMLCPTHSDAKKLSQKFTSQITLSRIVLLFPLCNKVNVAEFHAMNAEIKAEVRATSKSSKSAERMSRLVNQQIQNIGFYRSDPQSNL